MRTLVVTAANESFMPLLRGLVQSLQRLEPRPFAALACLDLGLAAPSRDWIARHAAHVVTPQWDLPVAPALRARAPHLRGLTARPFLRDYFPGYDVHLWIDADAWVQEPFALDWYLAAAGQGSLAIVPQIDRAYRHAADSVEWRTGRMRSCFGEAAGQRALWDAYFNAGVFALKSDAPHWDLWARHFKAGLDATDGMVCCDQTALNHALWTEQPDVLPLPALCNWLCHLATPGVDMQRQRFCEPYAPNQTLGILHLTAGTKNLRFQIDDSGGTREFSLRFPGPRS